MTCESVCWVQGYMGRTYADGIAKYNNPDGAQRLLSVHGPTEHLPTGDRSSVDGALCWEISQPLALS